MTVLGIDIGGTNFRAGIVENGRKIITFQKYDLHADAVTPSLTADTIQPSMLVFMNQAKRFQSDFYIQNP